MTNEEKASLINQLISGGVAWDLLNLTKKRLEQVQSERDSATSQQQLTSALHLNAGVNRWKNVVAVLEHAVFGNYHREPTQIQAVATEFLANYREADNNDEKGRYAAPLGVPMAEYILGIESEP